MPSEMLQGEAATAQRSSTHENQATRATDQPAAPIRQGARSFETVSTLPGVSTWVGLIQREPITAAVLCLGVGFLLGKLVSDRTQASTAPLPGDPWGDLPDPEPAPPSSPPPKREREGS